METADGETGSSWTEVEIEATTATYFQMLRTQELGQALNKAEHNNRLQARISARSRGYIYIYLKRGNIGAVLLGEVRTRFHLDPVIYRATLLTCRPLPTLDQGLLASASARP